MLSHIKLDCVGSLFFNFVTCSLQENNVSDRGVEDVSKGLVKNKSLQFLGLQYNDITNTGALYLGKSMRSNMALKTLYLFGNRINEQGMGEAVHCMAWTQANQVMFDIPVGEHVM
jgi:Ran GTPase-activating protein (RanGAP) involved in mRNA processing and transport